MLVDKYEFEDYLERIAKFLQRLWYLHDGKPEIVNAISAIDMVIESYALEYGFNLSKLNCIPEMRPL